VNIDHQFFVVPAHQRYEALKRLIDFNPGMYAIIFTRTKADAHDISERLAKAGYEIEALHGDLSQQQRDKVMGRFRSKSLQLLIATDVAARGIDVDSITHVINYELPDDMEVYTHRSGRTGRAGKTGICLSICHSRESYKIRSLEKMINAKFHKVDVPSGKDVCRKQFFHFMEKLMQADVSHGDYETYMPDLIEKFADVSKEEVLQRVAALEFSHFLKYYENADDLNRMDNRGSDRRQFERSASDMNGSRKERTSFNRRDSGYTRLFINLGTKDGFYKASFLQFILDESNLKKEVLGKIDMRDMPAQRQLSAWLADRAIFHRIGGKLVQGQGQNLYRCHRQLDSGAFDGNPAVIVGDMRLQLDLNERSQVKGALRGAGDEALNA
jgi:ATP-dependent RNA helicase DeaD